MSTACEKLINDVGFLVALVIVDCADGDCFVWEFEGCDVSSSVGEGCCMEDVGG